VEGNVIRLDGVRFAYPGGPDVIDAREVGIEPGLTLLLGPNGAGKSTLLRLMAGVERPREGRISIHGHDLWKAEVAARQPIAYVPEQPELTPYATIEEIVRLVCRLRCVPEEEAAVAIERVGLAGHAARSIRQLSQGQRRRAVFAAARVGQPSVLLLDEPLEAMDRAMRDEIVRWIRESVEQGRTVVAASHEFDDFVETASAALSVRDGSAMVHPLPDDPAQRRDLLDTLARGV
jgi:ABC-type multidrug transport system ATPase subunit